MQHLLPWLYTFKTWIFRLLRPLTVEGWIRLFKTFLRHAETLFEKNKNKNCLKGIVHFEIKMWYLSAYPKGIQDVGVIQVIWVRTHIRCVTRVCARSGSRCIHTGRRRQRLTEGVSEAWCWRNFSSANGGVSQSDRLMQIPNPVHATPEKYVIGCCNYDGASAPRFRHALRQALTPTPRVNAAWARAHAHTCHTPDVCAHSDHLDMVVYKR